MKAGKRKIINRQQMKRDWLRDILNPDSTQGGCISEMIKFWLQEVEYHLKPSSRFLVSPKPLFFQILTSRQYCWSFFPIIPSMVSSNFNSLWDTFIRTRFRIQDENTSSRMISWVLEKSHVVVTTTNGRWKGPLEVLCIFDRSHPFSPNGRMVTEHQIFFLNGPVRCNGWSSKFPTRTVRSAVNRTHPKKTKGVFG